MGNFQTHVEQGPPTEAASMRHCDPHPRQAGPLILRLRCRGTLREKYFLRGSASPLVTGTHHLALPTSLLTVTSEASEARPQMTAWPLVLGPGPSPTQRPGWTPRRCPPHALSRKAPLWVWFSHPDEWGNRHLQHRSVGRVQKPRFTAHSTGPEARGAPAAALYKVL